MIDSVTKRLEELEQQQGGDELVVPLNATPVEFFQAVYRDPKQSKYLRMKAAEAAAQYVHPKLAVTAAVNGEHFGAILERAIKRSGKVIEHSARMIEHQSEPE